VVACEGERCVGVWAPLSSPGLGGGRGPLSAPAFGMSIRGARCCEKERFTAPLEPVVVTLLGTLKASEACGRPLLGSSESLLDAKGRMGAREASFFSFFAFFSFFSFFSVASLRSLLPSSCFFVSLSWCFRW